MLNIYCNKSVNRLPGVRDRATAGLRSNRFKASIIKKWLCAVLCFAFVFSASWVAVPQAAHAAEEGYLFDRVITWADGTTEHVQIGKDGFFALDGTKRRLLGMEMEQDRMPYGQRWEWWHSGNLALYDKEFTYLESAGVRLVTILLGYYSDFPPGIPAEAERFAAFANLAYKHKIFVIPHFIAKGMPGFCGSTNPDFSVHGTDTLGAWVGRFSDIWATHQNVVAVIAECEIDNPFTEPPLGGAVKEPQKYTWVEAKACMEFIVGIMKSKLNVPIVHNLVGVDLRNPDIKKVALAATDFPCFTVYPESLTELNVMLDRLMSWVGEQGYPTEGWWDTELNKKSAAGGCDWLDVDNFTSDYIKAVFNHGASVVVLYTSNRTLDECGNPTTHLGFFDNDGNPKPSLLEVAKAVTTLQAPISQPATTPTDTYTIIATAGANGSISPTGNVVINQGGNQTFTITTDAGYHVADVLVDGASVGAVASYNFTNVTANHTISASFAADTVTIFTITASAGANGSISPSGNVVINQGGNQTFTITPDAGYHVADVLVDGASVGAVASYNFTNVTADHTISASFAADTVTTFTITASAGANGSMSPTGTVAVNHGADQSFTVTPDAGYHVADVLVDGASVGAVTSYTFSNVTDNHTINASFTQNQYTLTVDVNSSGSVAKVPNQATYSFGSAVQMTATADPGSSFSGWSGDLTGSTNPATIAVDGNKTVTATFAPLQYTLSTSVSPSGSGSISLDPPGGTHNSGTIVTVTATPASGWQFAGWTGSVANPSSASTTVTMDDDKTVTANFTISAGTITVTTPNGGEAAFIGEPLNITWNSSHVTGKVNIYISRNAGTAWQAITPRGGVANTGTYSWPVTGPAATQARVKVASTSIPTVFDTSNANFTISAGTITVTTPNGGETAFIGEPLNITWNSSHVTGKVNIYASRNAGTSWQAITPRGGVPNTGTYSWPVTGPATTRARVKVASTSILTVFDTSNANFTISASTITKP